MGIVTKKQEYTSHIGCDCDLIEYEELGYNGHYVSTDTMYICGKARFSDEDFPPLSSDEIEVKTRLIEVDEDEYEELPF